MKVIERSAFRDENGVISLENRLSGTLKHGLRWYSEMEAQEVVTQRLAKSLEDDHTLIRNLVVPGSNVTVPLILISPQGMRVLIASPLRGVYRAKLDEWLVFDGGSRRFKRTRPNLQGLALSMSQTVLKYITGQGYPLPEIESVLIFTNPRTHVDMARPTTRIILADAIDHFAAGLQELPAIMDGEDIRMLVDTLTHPATSAPGPVPEGMPTPVAVPSSQAAGPAEIPPRSMDLPQASAPPSSAPSPSAAPARASLGGPGAPPAASPSRAAGPLREAAPSPRASGPRSEAASPSATAHEAAPRPIPLPTSSTDVSPDAPLAARRVRLTTPGRRLLGLTRAQLLVLVLMLAAELVILAAMAYVVLTGTVLV